jgi:pimeloyl-ACP methyl ester carboxylesterase
VHIVKTADGRSLATEEWGRPDGRPVLYAHGTPMSRLARYPDDRLFETLNVRLITYDRPGFGASSPDPGRQVADAAADMSAIVDAYGIDRLPVFGVSGGGPHALAFAARQPERVSRVATLASPAPCDAAGLDWFADMVEMNRDSATAALAGRSALAEHFANSGSLDLAELLPDAERAVLQRPEVRAMLTEAYAEAVRPGIDGWIDDELALFGLPWGFAPQEIAVPAVIWHGGTDRIIPPTHGRWLTEQIPNAVHQEPPDAGHVGHFDATPAILRWLLSEDAPESGA